MPGRLIVIDPSTLDMRASVAIGMTPAHVVCDPQSRFAYATLSSENAVAVVNLQTMRVVAKILTGAFPHGLRMSQSASARPAASPP